MRVVFFYAFCNLLAFGKNACTNIADQKIWNVKGKANFDADMISCGRLCWGRGDCMKKCMKSVEGYSNACTQCFGDTAACTKSNCFFECVGVQTPSCKKCIDDFCTPTLKSCSG